MPFESNTGPDEFRALVLTGPDTIGGRILRRFWHPVM